MSKKKKKTPRRAIPPPQPAMVERLSPETREVLEIMGLLEGLEDIMPVDLERGTVGLNLQSPEDRARFAAASARIAQWHNKLVAEGKISGTPVHPPEASL